MRLKHLICGEFRLLMRYGIVFLYLIFTLIYLCVLAVIPQSAREITAVILVFTDPAAMGLFFIGAMVLFEKSQRVESSLGVAPIKLSEYIIAKVIPLMIIAVFVGLVLCVFAGISKLTLVLSGVALASSLFSLCGLMVGANIKTLNGFMIAMVPFEVVLCLPSVLYLFGVLNLSAWMLHPGVAAITLIQGKQDHWLVALLVLIAWIIPAFLVCRRMVKKSFCRMGGAKL